jgi:hypothetical protein
MEEILPSLKSMLKESIDISHEKENLLIKIEVKSKIQGKLAEKDEVIIMLKMFGGLREDIPMDIQINDESKTIKLKFETEEDLEKIQQIMEDIWDNAVDLLEKALQGDFKSINEIPNIDD